MDHPKVGCITQSAQTNGRDDRMRFAYLRIAGCSLALSTSNSIFGKALPIDCAPRLYCTLPIDRNRSDNDRALSGCPALRRTESNFDYDFDRLTHADIKRTLTTLRANIPFVIIGSVRVSSKARKNRVKKYCQSSRKKPILLYYLIIGVIFLKHTTIYRIII